MGEHVLYFANYFCVSSGYMHILLTTHIQSTKQSSTAFLAYVLMSGLQFSQAAAVVRRMVSAGVHCMNLTQLCDRMCIS